MEGVQPLGVTQELEGWTADRLKSIWAAVDARTLRIDPEPKIVPVDPAHKNTATQMPDLPVRPVQTAKLQHLFDLIGEYEGHIDIPVVTAFIKGGLYSNLGAPFCNNDGQVASGNRLNDVGYSMQVNIEKLENGKYNIAKWIQFDSPQRYDNVKDFFIHGVAFQFCSTRANYRVKKAAHHVWTQLHGTKVLQNCWADENQKQKKQNNMSNEARAEGYKFIRDNFTAEPVTKVKPAVFDDGLLQKQMPDILKAFLNPSEEDATIWARYSSASMDQGSSRQVCGNTM